MHVHVRRVPVYKVGKLFFHKNSIQFMSGWPVAGAEETVMQSTVIIICVTRGSRRIHL